MTKFSNGNTHFQFITLLCKHFYIKIACWIEIWNRIHQQVWFCVCYFIMGAVVRRIEAWRYFQYGGLCVFCKRIAVLKHTCQRNDFENIEPNEMTPEIFACEHNLCVQLLLLCGNSSFLAWDGCKKCCETYILLFVRTRISFSFFAMVFDNYFLISWCDTCDGNEWNNFPSIHYRKKKKKKISAILTGTNIRHIN